MGKKLFSGIAAIGIALISIPLLSAFEAHVINVTAQIENGVEYITVGDPIDFGTVFPQEKLDKTFDVELSQTFINNPEFDLLQYSVTQQPKCWNASTTTPELDRKSTRLNSSHSQISY